MKSKFFLALTSVVIILTSCTKTGINDVYGQNATSFAYGQKKMDGVGYIHAAPILLKKAQVGDQEADWVYNKAGGFSSSAALVYVNYTDKDGVPHQNYPVTARWSGGFLDEDSWILMLYYKNTTDLKVSFPFQMTVSYDVDQYGNDRWTVR